MIHTYNPKKVTSALGSHMVSGYSDGSFISIEPNADATSYKVGCDGEIVRSISPDSTYKVKFTLMQGSPTNKFLLEQVEKDRIDGSGLFPISVADLMGGVKFSAPQAWVSKVPAHAYDKEAGTREWEITTSEGDLSYD